VISNVYVIVIVSDPVTVTLLMSSAASATELPGVEQSAKSPSPAFLAQMSIPLIVPGLAKSEEPAVNTSASVCEVDGNMTKK